MKKHLIYLLVILVIMVGSTIINQLPDGHIISGSDLPYILNVENHMSDTLFVWSNVGNGRGAPDRPISVAYHYIISFILKFFGLSDSQVINVNYFLFIFLAAVSAYTSLGILSKFKIKPFIYFICAIFYSFNSFTLFGFTASWMYHPIFDIYITLPLICVLFLRGLLDNNKRYLAISVIVVILSLSGFSNPAFLISLLLFLILLTLMLLLFGLIKKQQLITVFIILSFYLFGLAFYLIPLSFEFLFGTTFSFSSSNVINIASSKVINSFRLMNDNPLLFFPANFPYPSFLKSIYFLLSFYPAIFVFLVLLFAKKQDKKIVHSFITVFIVFIYIAVKIEFSTLKNLSLYIFSLPLLNGLRAADKTYPFIAFLAILFLFYFLKGVSEDKEIVSTRFSKYKRLVPTICFIIIAIYPLPFYLGKFQQTMKMDSPTISFRHLVKVPPAYEKIANYINKDKGNYKIIHMPYGGVPYGFEAVLWSYYPKWRFLGSDVTRYYFDKPVINPMDYFGDYNFGAYFHKNPFESKAFVNTARILGVRYLINDANVSGRYFKSFNKMLATRQMQSNFKLIKRIDNLELFRIKKQHELPQIYTSYATNTSSLVTADSKDLPALLSRSASQPNIFLSKFASDERSLKYAGSIIFFRGGIMELAIDLLPQKIDKFGTHISINKKKADFFVPFNSSYNVFIKVKQDKNEAKRKNKFVYMQNKILKKDMHEPYEDSLIAKSKLYGKVKPGDWKYKGVIGLKKGKNKLRVSKQIQEVVIVRSRKYKYHLKKIHEQLKSKKIVFYVQKSGSQSNYKVAKLPSSRESLIKNRSKFEKINSTKYIVKSANVKWLVFSESFHNGWKAYDSRVNWWQALWRKPIPESKHFLVNGYANAWSIDKSIEEVTLYFWPQSIFYIGIIISSLTITSSLGYLVYAWKTGRKELSS